jgi:hypothetical protein
MRYYMLDLETLGIEPGAVILQIGCVQFGPAGIIDKRSWDLDPAQSDGNVPMFDTGTLKWWLNRPAATRAKAFGGDAHFAQSLVSLARMLDGDGDVPSPEDKRVWANGASFDFPHLAHAYDRFDMGRPWAYWQERDFRTVRAIVAPHLTMESAPECRHDALVDAVMQAKFLCLAAEKFPQLNIFEKEEGK